MSATVAASSVDEPLLSQESVGSAGSLHSTALQYFFCKVNRDSHKQELLIPESVRGSVATRDCYEVVDSPPAALGTVTRALGTVTPPATQLQVPLSWGGEPVQPGLSLDDDQAWSQIAQDRGTEVDEASEEQSLGDTAGREGFGDHGAAAVPTTNETEKRIEAKLNDMEKNAILNFCTELGKETATLDEIIAHGEGVVGFWATKSLNTNARSPLGQSFQRSIVMQPKWKDGYLWLPDSMKQEFRLQWSFRRDWQFTKETKTVINRCIRSVEDRGEMLPEITIASRLGSADNPLCMGMAKSYVTMCEEVAGPFVQYNSWLGVKCYLFVMRLISSRCEKEWQTATQNYTEENVWETKIEQQKALRKFAHQMGRPVQSVSIDEIEATTLGVKGWAEAAVVVPFNKTNGMSGPGDDEPGKQTPPSKKQKPEQASPTIASAEKEFKAILSMQAHIEIEYASLKIVMDNNKQHWQWADSYIKQMSKAEEKIIQFETNKDDDFMKKFKIGMLSATMLKDLRKAHESTYIVKVMTTSASLQTLLNVLASLVAKVQEHVSVETEPSGTVKGKAKGKAKAKPKNKAPAASLKAKPKAKAKASEPAVP